MKTSYPGNSISATPLRRTEPLPLPRLFSNELMMAFGIHPVEFPLDVLYQDRPGTDA